MNKKGFLITCCIRGLLAAISLIIFNHHLSAQNLMESSQVNIVLTDSTEVLLFTTNGNHKKSQSNCYYYLPVNLRLSYRDSIPEFSFMAFDRDADGVNDGGIMHLLLTWGLTGAQLSEAEQELKKWTDSTAFILGAVDVQSNTFLMEEDTELAKILDRSLRSRSSAPRLPGSKMALSFMFSEADTQKMEALLANEDALMETQFGFDLETRGLRGRKFKQLQLRKSFYALIGNTNLKTNN